MTVELKLNVSCVWRQAREARRKVDEAATAAGLEGELRAATVMTAAELIENAIKYGESLPGCDEVEALVAIGGERVRIEVSNGARSREALDDLFERVGQIAASPDRQGLYVARLEELLRDPAASGKLGLYRIGFEGGFDLACSYDAPVLTVRATRSRP